MPKVNGALGADGEKGGRALARELDRMATEGGVKGVHARLRYLVGSERGYTALDRAGVSAQKRTLQNWLEETSTPRRETQDRINRAYEQVRRHNMAANIKRRLTEGRGAQIEIHPVDQSGVQEPHRRELSIRRVNVRPRTWESIVDEWDAGGDLDDEWDDISGGLGSDGDAYARVSGVGIAA